MNDDFLKQHQKRPNPHFVEDLYQDLNKSKRWSTLMHTNKTRLAFFSLTFLLVGILSLAISPTARAALLSMFSINGVEVTIDDETNTLTTEGNPDAILAQGDNFVVIEGENDQEFHSIELVDEESQYRSLAEYQAENPSFVMPTTLPEGYTFNEESFMFEPLMLMWEKETGEWINYFRGAPPQPPAGVMEAMEDRGGDDIEFIEQPLGFEQFETPGTAELISILSGETDGEFYQVTTNDSSLTEADLEAIVPE